MLRVEKVFSIGAIIGKNLAPDRNRKKPQAVVRIAHGCASACGHAAR
jgi:hypothetical protein